MEIGIFVDTVEIRIGEGIRGDFGPGVFNAHGPTVAKVILVTDGGGFGGDEGVAYVAKVGFKFLLKSVADGVDERIGVVGPHKSHRLLLDGVERSFEGDGFLRWSWAGIIGDGGCAFGGGCFFCSGIEASVLGDGWVCEADGGGEEEGERTEHVGNLQKSGRSFVEQKQFSSFCCCLYQ